MTQPTAEALDACIRLMLRAAPHPEDRDLWHDTLRQASIAADSARADLSARRPRLGVVGWLALGAALLTLGWCISPALAQDRITWASPRTPGKISVMELRATTSPGAVAELWFLNEDIHEFDESVQNMDFGTLTLSIRLQIDSNGLIPDTLTVTPPEGFMAIPQTLTVPEGAAVTVLIFPLETLTN